MKKGSFIAVGFAVAVSCHAAIFTFSNINEAIPDGDATGLVDVRTITGSAGLLVDDITVSLNISGTGFGGFNGDLFVSLEHESGYSVLLNRVGARPGLSSGYSDSGLNVTFTDQASDIHNYRFTLNGSHSTPLSGSLNGTFAPDGRTADPGSVLDSSGRSAFLDSFHGSSLDGVWTLFVADLSTGGTQRLDGWGMNISVIPEPKAYAAVAGIGLLIFAVLRKKIGSASRVR
jgi:subtilisin-like proprotein convertase family protein